MMKKLRRLIRKIKKRTPETVRITGVFLLVLLICTVISRATSALITPYVECCLPSKMAIEHTVTKTGSLMGSEEVPIYVYDGIMTDTVSVQAGDIVEKGDTLMKLNMDDLQRVYTEKGFELAGLETDRKYAYTKSAIQQADHKLTVCRTGYEQLEKLTAGNGIVKADIAGEIKEVRVSSGKVTEKSAVIVLTDASKGYIFETTITEEEKKYVVEGENAKVTVDKSQEYFPVTSVQSDKNNPGNYIVQVFMSGDTYRIGMQVTVTFSHNSEPYDFCVPIEALRGDNGGQYYILILGTKNSILGEELVTKKISVTLDDSNSKYAAVNSAALQVDDRVVCNSSKQIETGDVVRESRD
ncbi:MAG: efflux RND transporter periplasmic adaptor subunit [Lachnospiraceae bacterium]|nr:efflux RND transporter periplasmic adaptor subunit [Lachnospiraceae bacterium]